MSLATTRSFVMRPVPGSWSQQRIQRARLSENHSVRPSGLNASPFETSVPSNFFSTRPSGDTR